MTTRSSLEKLAGSAAAGVPAPPKKRLTRFGIPLLLIGLVVILLASTAWNALVPARAVRAVTVAVRSVEVDADAMPEMVDAGAMVQAPGWIEPDPFPTYVAALEQGVVEDILKVEGDPVAAGEVVATLVDDRARIRFARAEAALSLALAQQETASMILAKATAELATLGEETRRVAVARAAIEELETGLGRSDAEIVAAEAAVERVRDELERKVDLVDQGAVAEAAVTRLRLEVEAGEARVESLRQQRSGREAALTAARAELVAATSELALRTEKTVALEEAKSRLVETSAQINLAQAERDDARLALDRCRVVSPVSGRVIELLSSPGSAINYGNGSHGSHILHVYDPKELQVRADIPLADAARVRVGQAARIVVDVLPDRVFEGRVTRFLNKADISKNTIEAKVRIEDPDPLLKPEMLARVRIMPMAPESADHGETGGSVSVQRVFIPEDALVRTEDGTSIWVIDELDRGRGRAGLRAVELGENVNDGWVEVVRGLRAGEKVILDNESLDAGDRVEIAERNEEV